MNKQETVRIFRNPGYVSVILLIFYSVGIAGMVWEVSRPYFIHLTPFALLLSLGFLMINHLTKPGFKELTAVVIIYLTGYFIEVIGVNTGLIFGEYVYGAGLGPKLLATPLMIGINWLMLVYLTAAFFQSLSLKPLFVVLLGATTMLIYDLVLEQIAPVIDLWSWAGDKVPFQNYVSWWLIAVLMHSLVAVLRIKLSNRVAMPVFIAQFLFFVILLLLM
ncbi:MAG: carotenoid biosynthesis protein [Paludibacter sp.]|jgi:putative membrane protein|nr:carotenoid biosynthesis protein [Paludibacter sp.]